MHRKFSIPAVSVQEDEKPSQTTYEEETPSPNQGSTNYLWLGKFALTK